MDATRTFGAAYIFELGENDTWVETQKIVASDRIRDDEFGTSIAIDGNRIISGTIGKSYDPEGTYEPSRGVAYVFEKNALGTWNQVQKFFALDGNMGDELGYAVAVSGDIAMVSALLQDYDSLGTNYLPSTGAVYVLDANAEPLVSAFQCPYLQADYGSSCDDGNDLTENDALNDECVCLGTPIPDCPDLSANIGDACNDGNTNTLGDIVTDDCICMGQVPDVGTVCEASIEVTSLPYLTTDNTENYGDDYSSSNFPSLAPGALGNPTSSYLNGDDVVYSYTPTANGLISITVSDRGDWVGFFVFTGCPFASTLGGRAEQNAETVMTIEQLPVISGLTYYIVISTWANPQTTPYTLSISEFEFDCPELSANIGDSCDDNDNTTFNDNVSETCECVGTPYDCPALTANIGDACDDGNANSTQDVITENCECQGVIVYDCPDLSANVGDSCDDGNLNTENDIVTASCFCTGTFVFDCPEPYGKYWR